MKKIPAKAKLISGAWMITARSRLSDSSTRIPSKDSRHRPFRSPSGFGGLNLPRSDNEVRHDTP